MKATVATITHIPVRIGYTHAELGSGMLGIAFQTVEDAERHIEQYREAAKAKGYSLFAVLPKTEG